MNTKERVCKYIYIYIVRNCATWCFFGSTDYVTLNKRLEEEEVIVFMNSVRILTFP